MGTRRRAKLSAPVLLPAGGSQLGRPLLHPLCSCVWCPQGEAVIPLLPVTLTPPFQSCAPHERRPPQAPSTKLTEITLLTPMRFPGTFHKALRHH